MSDRLQLLTGVVDRLLDSVLVVDESHKIIFANATAAGLTNCQDLEGRELKEFFEATLQTGPATLRTFVPGEQIAVALVVTEIPEVGTSLSFRKAPENGAKSDPEPETSATTELEAPDTPLRNKAIRSIELRLAAESSTQKHYAVVLVLSQFDMFRLRYGLNSAEKLVHAFSAHLIKSLPPEDRLYNWSNRTVVVLVERDSGMDEVRLEMTAFCSRRVDYYLAATGRSALVTLSASWTLIPLYDCPEARKDPKRIVDQIDAFERLHTKRK